MRKILLLLTVVAVLTGCTRLSANPLQNLQGTLVGKTLVQDIQDASWDLDQSLAVGILDLTDPAPTCLHDIMTKAGIDPNAPKAPSFVPRRSGIVSEGAIIYAEVKILQRLQAGGLGGVVSPACKMVLGQFMIDALGAQRKLLPGGGFLPILK